MNIGLIPARGGSKSIRKKNIIKLGGYPLIYYTIQAAKLTERIDRIIVSTDNEEIRKISLRYGAEAPFIRPKEYSRDYSGDLEVVQHLLTWLKVNENKIPEMITYLRPDFPFRQSRILNHAISVYKNDSFADGLRSIKKSKELPYKTWLIENGYLKELIKYKNFKDPHNIPRQLFPNTYWPCGYLEIYDTKLAIKENTLHGKSMIPYLIEEDLIEIGFYQDLEKAKDALKNFEFC